jgi:hypothetical protein
MRVLLGRLQCAVINVDSPDTRSWCTECKGERDRPIAAAEIEQVAVRGRKRRMAEKRNRSGVDLPVREQACFGFSG